MDRLTNEAVQEQLKTLRGWSLKDQYLVKSFRFQTYPKAIAFVNQIAAIAEERKHHPDLMVSYASVGVRFSTHDANGLTQADFDAARAVDALRS